MKLGIRVIYRSETQRTEKKNRDREIDEGEVGFTAAL